MIGIINKYLLFQRNKRWFYCLITPIKALPSKYLLVLNTSSTSLQRNNFTSSKTPWRRLENVLRTSSKTSWWRLQHVLKTSYKTSSRRLGRRKIVTLKTSWRRLEDMSWRRLEDMSWRCLEDMSWRRLEDIMETSKILTGDICI